jgi:hypothetical protein
VGDVSKRHPDGAASEGSPPAPVVHSITGAASAHSDDQDLRIRRYLVSMGIRTVCVVLAFVVDGPLRWVFAILAVILPYIAVVMANVAGGRGAGNMAPVTLMTPPRMSLPPAGSTQPAATGGGVGQTASPERTSSGSGERTA